MRRTCWLSVSSAIRVIESSSDGCRRVTIASPMTCTPSIPSPSRQCASSSSIPCFCGCSGSRSCGAAGGGVTTALPAAVAAAVVTFAVGVTAVCCAAGDRLSALRVSLLALCFSPTNACAPSPSSSSSSSLSSPPAATGAVTIAFGAVEIGGGSASSSLSPSSLSSPPAETGVGTLKRGAATAAVGAGAARLENWKLYWTARLVAASP